MPNWAEGTIKVRGTKNQIIDYLSDTLECVDFLGNDIKIEILDDGTTITFKGEDVFYFKGTQRGFVRTEDNILSFDFWGEPETIEIIEMPFKQAWAVEASEFVKLSKKHGVDIKIFTFERGMGFTQEIEIIKGKITRNKTIKYENYQWDVPFNSLGG